MLAFTFVLRNGAYFSPLAHEEVPVVRNRAASIFVCFRISPLLHMSWAEKFLISGGIYSFTMLLTWSASATPTKALSAMKRRSLPVV